MVLRWLRSLRATMLTAGVRCYGTYMHELVVCQLHCCSTRSRYCKPITDPVASQPHATLHPDGGAAMLWFGVALSVACALNNSLIDGLRKHAASKFSSTTLVCVVALLDAVISLGVAYLAGGLTYDVRFHDPHAFGTAVLGSAALLLLSKFLYQQSLAMSPLSLTIPYLSFTPIFLVATAYLFVGEEVTQLAFIGVCIIAAGGYLLSRQSAPGPQAGSTAASSTAGLETVLKTSGKGRSSSGGGVPAWSSMDPAHKASTGNLELLEQHMSDKNDHSVLLVDSHSSSELPAPIVPYHSTIWSKAVVPNGTAHLAPRTSTTLASAGVSMGGRRSAVDTTEALATTQSRASLTDVLAVVQPSGIVAAGLDGKGHPAAKSSTCRTSGNRWESGTTLMVCVSALYSLTAALDKLGVLHSPNVWVYFALQRLVIGCASAVYLLIHAPHAFGLLLTRHVRLLALISAAEMLAVCLFLEAIRYLFVSYVVAIKRCNILLSVLTGGLLFNEPIKHRIPYVVLMLTGVCLIALDPDASTVHTSSHT